ncbi:hypothetical protein EOL70_09650 [Leucothrix sargassi]|nr:hypothetical protein EOL70_09650 [Leucothrix sargassi]
MQKNTIENDDYNDFGWDEDANFDEREEEKSKSKRKHSDRKLNVKRRMDDYLDYKRAKMHEKYLDFYELDD